jgi:hypothetical protein
MAWRDGKIWVWKGITGLGQLCFAGCRERRTTWRKYILNQGQKRREMKCFGFGCSSLQSICIRKNVLDIDG